MKYILTLFLTLLIINFDALCCTCGPLKSIKEEFHQVQKIISGTIIERSLIISMDSIEYKRLVKNGMGETQARRFTTGGYSQYKIVLSKTYKGTFRSDTLLILTGLTSGSCGFNFQVGEKYIVYGYPPSKKQVENPEPMLSIWTNNCTRTKQFNDKESKKLTKLAKHNFNSP